MATKFIYLIKDDRNLYKIGISKNDPLKRLKQLQTGNPSILELTDIFKSQYANVLETTLHRHYNIHNVLNEWFELDEDQVNDFINICLKYESNFDSINDNTHFKKRIK